MFLLVKLGIAKPLNRVFALRTDERLLDFIGKADQTEMDAKADLI